MDGVEPKVINDTLLRSDWRMFMPPETETDAGPPAPAAPMFLRARPASLGRERERAKQIIESGKETIRGAFRAVTDGDPIDYDALQALVRSVTASVLRHPMALPGMGRLKTKHEYTYLHSVAVCGLMVALARRLDEPGLVLEDVGLAGLLHDIGKARIPRAVLDKPAELTVDEFRLVREHPVRGHELLNDVAEVPAVVRDVCLHHHERLDGSGYPFGLKDKEISLVARMAAICDVYDAVTSARAYKRSWSPAEALEWMSTAEGHFDRRVLAEFRKLIGAFPPGSLVMLQSGRLGIVADELTEDPLRPAICAFFSTHAKRPIDWVMVDPGRDPILSVERADRWGLTDWRTLRRQLLAFADVNLHGVREDAESAEPVEGLGDGAVDQA
ncbi:MULTISPECIES: HD-GYP domain-containing protein [unclassified Sphingomonas]|jgi:putative nucleotidyltransferase with HDIG domain|uniref:HD-GYP domain-containing protein n=1 Tax=unclassified Sphingomonas TaxID=196159 RepID=UPI000836B488|nr:MULTISPECIES: HD-GYP domain-containing protein [unclassified Sphingomonas]MCH4893922.1 HD domain-containing protein [Sphingomonas sp. SFZ2018-12]